MINGFRVKMINFVLINKKYIFMKRVLFASIVLISSFVSAQFSVFTADEYAISNNQTFTFNTTNKEVADLGFKILNYSDKVIIMKAQIVEIVGADGSDFEICFGGSCYYAVTEGQIIPQDPVAIQAGQFQGNYDHMWNKNTSSDKITYKIKFYMLDSLGNETGTPFYINYVYDKNMSVIDVEDNSSKFISNTIAKDELFISLEEDAVVSIYSLSGKLVKKASLKKGESKLSVRNLSKGNYIAVIETVNQKVKSQKIIIK